MNKSIYIILFSTMFLLFGCYSFYQIDVNELKYLKEDEVLKIKFENGENLEIENIKKTNLLGNQEIEFITIDSSLTIFSLKEIKKITIERFDYQKTLLTSLFIIIGALLLNGGIGSPGG